MVKGRDTLMCPNCGHEKRIDINPCRFCHGLPTPLRYRKGQCPKCGNTEINREGYCSYCVWKGTVGPGKELRVIIKRYKPCDEEVTR